MEWACGPAPLRKKWIGDFGNDQPKNATPPRNQSPSLRIGEITKFVDHLPDPFGKLRIDGGNAINRSGYGGGGNFRSSRDFTNVHGFFWKALSISMGGNSRDDCLQKDTRRSKLSGFLGRRRRAWKPG